MKVLVPILAAVVALLLGVGGTVAVYESVAVPRLQAEAAIAEAALSNVQSERSNLQSRVTTLEGKVSECQDKVAAHEGVVEQVVAFLRADDYTTQMARYSDIIALRTMADGYAC